MAFPRALCLFLALFIAALCCSTQAYVINVGGSTGWTVHPIEDYDIWAARLRFTMNDTLHFEYNKETDSVLEVNEDDYDSCNSNNPISKLENGVSSFSFDHSGAFYFITGNKTNCLQGQKMHIIVLAARHHETAAPSPASIAAPLTHTPSPSPSPAPAPAPAEDGTTITTFDVNAPTPAPSHSSARPVFNAAASIVSVVMVGLGLLGFIGIA